MSNPFEPQISYNLVDNSTLEMEVKLEPKTYTLCGTDQLKQSIINCFNKYVDVVESFRSEDKTHLKEFMTMCDKVFEQPHSLDTKMWVDRLQIIYREVYPLYRFA